MSFTLIFKKYIEPFVGIAVVCLLLILAGLLYQDNQLKKEISEECGWGEDDYICYCEYSDINRIKNELGENLIIENVEVDR